MTWTPEQQQDLDTKWEAVLQLLRIKYPTKGDNK